MNTKEKIIKFKKNLSLVKDIVSGLYISKSLLKKLLATDAKETIEVLYNFLTWRINRNKKSISYLPQNPPSDKFITAEEAVSHIKDGMTVATSGFVGCGICTIVFYAVRDSFEKRNTPKNLTWMSVSAQGGRGRVPGTIEELAVRGLLDKYICGHLETARAMLKLADEGGVELHTLPQGEITKIFELQGITGETSVESGTGIGTFLDPRCGTGSAVTPNAKENYITVKEDKLCFTLPKIEIAFLTAPFADKEGNLYFRTAPLISENREVALAAKKNGGKAFALVSEIIEKDEKNIGLSSEFIDGIVVNPYFEQIAGIPQKKYRKMFTTDEYADMDISIDQLRLINMILKATPYRTLLDDVTARIGASLFANNARKGVFINIGIGMPEEVCRLVYKSGIFKDLIFTTEAGAYGGLPAAGPFFGASINPEKLTTSAYMFEQYREKLEITVLGMLQVDSEGNVNVSKRGPKMINYVGPGGFCNLTHYAKTVIFIGSWMYKGKMYIKKNKLFIKEYGKPKFVEAVDHVTFNGKKAIQEGKNVYYVSNVGVFKLTEKGLMLVQVMPGVDIEKDIIEFVKAKIILPEDGKVEEVPENIITGENFSLRLEK